MIELLKCPAAQIPSSRGGPAGELGEARARIRGLLDQGYAEDTAQLPRAAYVHLCARQMRERDEKRYPAMAIVCVWHADRLDLIALNKDLQARPAPERRAIFYDLPTRVRKESAARRAAHADVCAPRRVRQRAR